MSNTPTPESIAATGLTYVELSGRLNSLAERNKRRAHQLSETDLRELRALVGEAFDRANLSVPADPWTALREALEVAAEMAKPWVEVDYVDGGSGDLFAVRAPAQGQEL